MAKDRKIRLDGGRVGLIVRNKFAPDHDPNVMEQHADCILPDGSPLGYFGMGNDTKINSVGLKLDGVVYDHSIFRAHRPEYVQLDTAVAYREVSTVLLIAVTKSEAGRFKDYWTELKRNPGTFHFVGANCSTHASEAFMAAGIVKKGIPGLDTPNNLYKQISKSGRDTESLTGYVGFDKRPGGKGFDLVVRPFSLDSGIAVPKPSKSARSIGGVSSVSSIGV